MDHFLIRCPSCRSANRVPASSEGRRGKCGSCHALLPPLYSRPVPLSDKSFDPFVRGFPGTLVAEFWAPWCPHCSEFAKAVETAAGEMAGRGAFVQINTQENPRLAARFNIRGVPTVIVFRNGKESERVSGAMDRQNFLAWCRQRFD